MDDKKKKKRRRRLMALGLALALVGYGSVDYVYAPDYEIIAEANGPFAKYSKGLIYIGNAAFLNDIVNVKEGDILVLDQRNGTNPNMKIFCSCEITDKNVRNEILEVLCRYEECYPSAWDRTIESMRLEWLMHNLSFDFNHQVHRTEDVDLDNNDQEYYDHMILNKLFKV